MPCEKKPLSIRVKNDKVILTLEKEGWDEVHGMLLDELCYDLRYEFTAAEILTQAIYLRGKEQYGETIDRALASCKRRIQHKNKTKGSEVEADDLTPL